MMWRNSRRLAVAATVLLLCGLGGLLSGCGGGSTGGSTGTQTQTAATPTFSPTAGTYSSTQSVAVSDATPGATIYYTLDGSTPTVSSTKYGGAITVASTETISAIAVASGYTNSAVASAAYTINLAAAATPTFSPAAGTYTSAQSVTISDATTGAVIYYTTDGSTPTTGSTQYSGAVSVSSTETIKAIAAASGYANSAVASAAYTINLAAAAMPTFSPAAGTYTSVQSVTISDATAGAAIYYTTDGSTPTTNATKYAGAITVSSTETIKAVAVANGYDNSAVASATYTITLPTATPAISPAGGTYTSAQSVTISDTTPNATIYYTTDGSIPTTNSTEYSGAITVSASETINAIAIASGYSSSAIAAVSYIIALADPETNMFFPMDFSKGSTGTTITTTPLGVVQGAKTQFGPMGVSPVQLFNPDRSDGQWDNPQAVVGALRPVAAANATSVADTRFIVNLTASFARVYSFQENITSINPTTDTIKVGWGLNPTAQGENYVSLPQPLAFNANGTAPTTLSDDTGAGLILGAGPSVYFIPRSGATLNQSGIAPLIPQQPSGTPVGNVTGLLVDDSNGNFAVVRDSSNGATPRFDMYDQKGNWLLSGPAGLVLANSLEGTAATNVIASGVNVANSITVSPTLNQTLSLYFVQQVAATGSGANSANAGSLYVQPATNGGQPTVEAGTIPNLSGRPSTANILFMNGMPSASGSPSSLLYVTDGSASTQWTFNMAPTPAGNAEALQATPVGNGADISSISSNSGISVVQSAGLVAITTNTTGVQTNIYVSSKLADGSIGAFAPAGNSSIGSGGILIVGSANDASRNFFFMLPNNAGSTMISGVDGNVLGANTISNPDPNGGAATTAVNPSIGSSVNIGN